MVSHEKQKVFMRKLWPSQFFKPMATSALQIAPDGGELGVFLVCNYNRYLYKQYDKNKLYMTKYIMKIKLHLKVKKSYTI